MRKVITMNSLLIILHILVLLTVMFGYGKDYE